MATRCPVGLDVQRLKAEVALVYDRVAREPDGEFHFHRGPAYAAEMLGYDRAALARLPPESTASFAGVGNPHAMGPLGEGERVLDVGCGAGTDLLLAALSVGPRGAAIGVDATASMVSKARAAALAMGLAQVDVRPGDALELPVEDASVDVVISNGVLNLAPDKERAFAELWRVLAPGGRLHLADIVVARELSEKTRSDIDLWTG